jgi:hypothetical protein
MIPVRIFLHRTEDSARTEGGREAPVRGGGSGAARAASDPGGFVGTYTPKSAEGMAHV